MARFLPGPGDLLALVAILVIATACAGLATWIDRRHASVDTLFVSGWGLVVTAATLFGVASAAPLVWILYPLLALGVWGAWRGLRECPDQWLNAGRLVVIGAPTLLVVAAASASQWDEFAHWLVNQRYLVDVGTFPRQGLPSNATVFAAYPYGLPLLGFLASRLTGVFVENAGALFNTVLVMVLAHMTIRVFCVSAHIDSTRVTWTAAALGFIGATLLNPTFVFKLVFTTYADWTTAVVLGSAVLTIWSVLNTDPRHADRLASGALHTGLAIAVLVALKQPNAILAVLLLIGVAVVTLLCRPFPLSTVVSLALRLVGPPLLVYVAWRYHVATQLPGREFTFFPLSDWLWAELGGVAARMLLIASKKGGYFGVMLVASGIAAWGAVRALRGLTVDPVARLALLSATLFVGYNLFLYVAYLGAFDPGEGRAAASYWRYNTQLGGVALVFAAAAAGALYRRYASGRFLPHIAGSVIVVSAIVLPVVFSPKIRFDLNPVTRYVRSVGVELSTLLPAGARLAIIDPGDNGKRTMLMRYELHRSRLGHVRRMEGADPRNPVAMRSAAVIEASDHIWVHVPSTAIEQAFAVTMPTGASHLLTRDDGRWKLARSWPYPGYTNPDEEDD